VRLVDLATGICTPQANLLNTRSYFAAAGLPASTRVSSLLGAQNAAWTWRVLPPMSVASSGCGGCVLSDGRFAVIGGSNSGIASLCEPLSSDDDGVWEPLPPMHDSRWLFTCAAVARCIIVAGGASQRQSTEVYDEALGRWLRLPCDLPHVGGLEAHMGSALL